MEIKQICKSFDELTPHQLYAILRLRNEVFVVEQNCVFMDLDDKDQESFHLMFFIEDDLVAYSRLIPSGLYYKEISFGRVVTNKHIRGKGLGKQIVSMAIENLYSLFGNRPIRIGAQFYLFDFYLSLGFKKTGDIYVEDGIDHIEMIKE
ncbi:MAG: GNAT family N-acetyltransferase [Sphingobacteriales bacterium]